MARGLAQSADREMRMIRATAKDIPDANSADWILITNNKAFLAIPDPGTRPERSADGASEESPRAILWTDDFSSLWHVLK